MLSINALALQLWQHLAALQLPYPVTDGPPAVPTGVQRIVSFNCARIRYKQPGKQWVCQTSVDDYLGYIS